MINMNGEVIGINSRKNSGMTSDGAVIEGLALPSPLTR